MAAPNFSEDVMIKEFRKRVGNILTDEQKEDCYLVRWLRAYDLNLDKCEEMLKATLLWRQQNKLDGNFLLDIKLDPFCVKEFPFWVETVDKLGQPVLYMPIGKWDFRKIISENKEEEFKTYINYLYETVCSKIKEQNKKRDPNLYPISQFTSIIDWNGYSNMQMLNVKAAQHMLHFAMIYEKHYPDLLHQLIYINCPSFINGILGLLKTVMSQKSLNKLTTHTGGIDKWKPSLLEHIDDDQLSIALKRMN